MHIEVESYAGHRGMQMPRRIHMDGRHIEVIETVDQWHGPDYRYFKVRGDDGSLYILRLDESRVLWELTMYQSARAQAISE